MQSLDAARPLPKTLLLGWRHLRDSSSAGTLALWWPWLDLVTAGWLGDSRWLDLGYAFWCPRRPVFCRY